MIYELRYNKLSVSECHKRITAKNCQTTKQPQDTMMNHRHVYVFECDMEAYPLFSRLAGVQPDFEHQQFLAVDTKEAISLIPVVIVSIVPMRFVLRPSTGVGPLCQEHCYGSRHNVVHAE